MEKRSRGVKVARRAESLLGQRASQMGNPCCMAKLDDAFLYLAAWNGR